MRIAVLTPVYGLYFQNFIFSIFKMYELENVRFDLISLGGSSNVTSARNSSIHEMLIREHTEKFKYDYFLFIDSDIVFTQLDVKKLLDHVVSGKECVSGVYFAKSAPFFPVAGYYDINKIAGGFPKVSKEIIISGKTIEVDWAGLGFVIIKREVLDKIEYPWFEMFVVNLSPQERAGGLIIKKEILSEDITFFTKIKNLGYKIYLDTSVLLKHIGYTNYSKDHFLAVN